MFRSFFTTIFRGSSAVLCAVTIPPADLRSLSLYYYAVCGCMCMSSVRVWCSCLLVICLCGLYNKSIPSVYNIRTAHIQFRLFIIYERHTFNSDCLQYTNSIHSILSVAIYEWHTFNSVCLQYTNGIYSILLLVGSPPYRGEEV